MKLKIEATKDLFLDLMTATSTSYQANLDLGMDVTLQLAPKLYQILCSAIWWQLAAWIFETGLLNIHIAFQDESEKHF